MEENKRIRILFATDGHADNVNPLMRKDDYLVSCVTELNECLEITRNYGCDAFIHGGDVFHRMQVNSECINSIMDVLLRDREGNEWGFPRYTAIGNHDIKHNPQNLEKSSLGTLITSGALECVEEIADLGIGFGHFRDKIEDQIGEGALLNKPHILLWILHANVTTGPFYETADYIQFKDMPLDPNCRMVLAGHIHWAMEQEREDGTVYINPGSITRNAATLDNLQRTPQALLVEYALDGSFLDWQYIPLKSCLPAKDIFKVEEIQAKKDKKKDTETFIQQISQMSSWTADDDKYESLKKSGQLKGLDVRIVNLAIQTLKDVNEKRMADQ